MIKESFNDYLKRIDPVSLSIAIIIFIAGILIAFLLDKFVIRKSKLSAHEKFLISKILYVITIFFSGFIVFHELGLHIAIVVSTLSVIGISFGVAGKDLISSFISGITLVGDFDIKIGDYIEVDNITGIIENIGLLYTNIKETKENILLKIPNSKIANTAVKNYSYYEYVKFQYTYIKRSDQDTSNLIKTIEAAKPYSFKDGIVQPKAIVENFEIGNIQLYIKKEAIKDFLTIISPTLVSKNIISTGDWKSLMSQISWQFEKTENNFFN